MSEKELDKVVSVDINEEMKQCYIEMCIRDSSYCKGFKKDTR